MRRALWVGVLAVAMVMALSGVAFAGEWNKGHFNEDGGNLPAKYHANSECLFNGQDELDVSNGGGEPIDFGSDDDLWSFTPAGAHNAAGIRVQSGGQITATGAGYVGQGEACNGHLNPLK
jgi:hypothetical protein